MTDPKSNPPQNSEGGTQEGPTLVVIPPPGTSPPEIIEIVTVPAESSFPPPPPPSPPGEPSPTLDEAEDGEGRRKIILRVPVKSTSQSDLRTHGKRGKKSIQFEESEEIGEEKTGRSDTFKHKKLFMGASFVVALLVIFYTLKFLLSFITSKPVNGTDPAIATEIVTAITFLGL